MRKLGHQVALDRPWHYLAISPDFAEDWFRASCCPKRADKRQPVLVATNTWENRELSVVLQKFRSGRYFSLTTRQGAVFYAGRCAVCGAYYWSTWDVACREWEEDEPSGHSG